MAPSSIPAIDTEWPPIVTRKKCNQKHIIHAVKNVHYCLWHAKQTQRIASINAFCPHRPHKLSTHNYVCNIIDLIWYMSLRPWQGTCSHIAVAISRNIAYLCYQQRATSDNKLCALLVRELVSCTVDCELLVFGVQCLDTAEKTTQLVGNDDWTKNTNCMYLIIRTPTSVHSTLSGSDFNHSVAARRER